MTTRTDVPVQQTTRLMWWFGAVSVAVSAGAAFQLLVLTTRTEDFFAWTIAVAPSAAFIGIFYLASAVMGTLALRQRAWAPARAALVPVVTFVGIVLVVTLLHLETFHLFSGGLLARAAAWTWLAVYVVTPTGYLVAFWWQNRAPGSDPARTDPLPRRARIALMGVAALLGVAGLAFLVAPLPTAVLWPWPLTALTGRMIGATLLGVTMLILSVLRTADLTTGRIAATGLVVAGVAAVVVALGYGASVVALSAPSTWVYLVAALVLAVAAATAVEGPWSAR